MKKLNYGQKISEKICNYAKGKGSIKKNVKLTVRAILQPPNGLSFFFQTF